MTACCCTIFASGRGSTKSLARSHAPGLASRSPCWFGLRRWCGGCSRARPHGRRRSGGVRLQADVRVTARSPPWSCATGLACRCCSCSRRSRRWTSRSSVACSAARRLGCSRSCSPCPRCSREHGQRGRSWRFRRCRGSAWMDSAASARPPATSRHQSLYVLPLAALLAVEAEPIVESLFSAEVGAKRRGSSAAASAMSGDLGVGVRARRRVQGARAPARYDWAEAHRAARSAYHHDQFLLAPDGDHRRGVGACWHRCPP